MMLIWVVLSYGQERQLSYLKKVGPRKTMFDLLHSP